MTSETKALETQAATAKSAATSPSYSITLRVEAPSGHRTASDLVAAVSATGASITGVDVSESGRTASSSTSRPTPSTPRTWSASGTHWVRSTVSPCGT